MGIKTCLKCWQQIKVGEFVVFEPTFFDYAGTSIGFE
jgi:hypothetical protein